MKRTTTSANWLCLLSLISQPLASARAADVKSYRIEPFVFISPRSQREITANVRWPAHEGKPRARSSRLPALLLFGGFEEAARVLELVHPGRPIVIASFDYPYQAPRKFRFPHTFGDVPKMRSAVRDTLEAIPAFRRALAQDPRIDPERMGIIGASFGAPFALRAAAEDPGFRAVAIVHGFGDIAGTIEHRLFQAWKDRLPRGFAWLAGPLSWSLGHLAPWVLAAPSPEADASALRENQKILMIEARDDQFIPKSAREALLRGLKRSASGRSSALEHIEMPGDHLQPGSEHLIEEILKMTEAWLLRIGFLGSP